MSKRSRFTFAIVVVGLAIAYLAFAGFRQGAMYYLTVGELLESAEELRGNTVRVSGEIVKGGESFDPAAIVFTFRITDGREVLTVKLNDVKPDSYGDATEAVVEGFLDEDGSFVADKMLLRCPSKYVSKVPGAKEE